MDVDGYCGHHTLFFRMHFPFYQPCEYRTLVTLFYFPFSRSHAYNGTHSGTLKQFLLEIGVVKDPADAGFYSGVTESIYAVAQLVTGNYSLLAVNRAWSCLLRLLAYPIHSRSRF